MARAFNGTDQYLSTDSGSTWSAPLTLACWFNSDTITSDQFLLSITNGDQDQSFDIIAGGAQASDPILARCDSGSDSFAETTAGYSVGQWHHACGVFTSSTDRAAFLDGANKGTDTTDISPSGSDEFLIGARKINSAISQYADAVIAEAAIWSAALTDAEVAILAEGVSPRMVRPQNLVAYWPLIGRYSPEIDIVGGYDLTLTNGPTNADHPRVFWGGLSTQPAVVTQDLRVTQVGVYAEQDGEALLVTQAGVYAEEDGEALHVTQAGAYAELEAFDVRVTQAGVYIEFTAQPSDTTVQYGEYDITDWAYSMQLIASMSQFDATSFASTAKEQGMSLAKWRLPLRLWWDSELDSNTMPDVVTTPSTGRNMRVQFFDGERIVSYTWLGAASIVEANVGGVTDGAIDMELELVLSGAPERTVE